MTRTAISSRVTRRKMLALLVSSAVLGTVGPQVAWGEQWPTSPVRIIIPYAAGGIADDIARLIQPVMAKSLGESVLVVNKPGASGSLATGYVARSKPDGYNILFSLTAAQTLNQYLYKDVRYDGLKDFTPICLLATNPLALVVNSEVPVHSVKELIAYAKAHPGQLNYSGAGGLTSYAGVIFEKMAGVKMVSVRYKGGAPALLATISGQAQLSFANYSDVLPWLRGDKVRVLALTSAKRFSGTPDVPTIAESGLPGYAVEGWSGLAAPVGTPKAIVDKLLEAAHAALKDPKVVAGMAHIAAVPVIDSPSEFSSVIKADMKKWQAAVASNQGG